MLPLLPIPIGSVILSEQPAYACAGPGTGLLAVQAVGSALVASEWYLRRKIYALFSKSDPLQHEAEAASAAEDCNGAPKS